MTALSPFDPRMFRPRPAHAALVAAAGLGGIAATAAGNTAANSPPSTPPEPSPAVDPTSRSHGLALRLTTLPVRALAHFVRDAESRRPRKRSRRHGFTVLRVRHGRRVTLRARPRGGVITKTGSRTEFGSRQTLTVAKRRGRWLGVTSTARPDGRLSWVDGRSKRLERRRTRVSIHLDLSRRRLELRDGRRTRRSVPVGVGAASSPTPPGRYSVTDKLDGSRYRGVYGRSILALNGRQRKLPPGWRGGDRLAIHGTPSGSIRGTSAGCVRADGGTLGALMRRAPLGAPVFIKR
jgi:hypothetical protein